jgi:hypothetical protein
MKIYILIITLLKNPLIWYFGVFVLIAITPRVVEYIIYKKARRYKK